MTREERLGDQGLFRVEKRRFRAVAVIISLMGEHGEGAASSSGRCTRAAREAVDADCRKTDSS